MSPNAKKNTIRSLEKFLFILIKAKLIENHVEKKLSKIKIYGTEFKLIF